MKKLKDFTRYSIWNANKVKSLSFLEGVKF